MDELQHVYKDVVKNAPAFAIAYYSKRIAQICNMIHTIL